MANLSDIIEKVKGIDPERMIGLRPPYPPVALQLSGSEALLVRLKRKRRGKPTLEAHMTRPLPEKSMPASIFQPTPAASGDLASRLRELFEASGTRPGRVSLILPDNLAKISLLPLPERPSSRKQLDQLVHSKMRRAVPFKLEDARLSYQILAGTGRQVSVLVMLIRRALIERLEQALSAVGARAGLIDICTPNLINFCRGRIETAAANGGDVALLNCSQNYFSLVIMRNEQLIFFRCKTFAVERAPVKEPNGALAREIASSFSYYREKLAGEGVGTAFVRTVGVPYHDIESDLRALGLEGVKLIDIEGSLEMGEGVPYDREVGQWLAPAVGAAFGKERLMKALDLNLASRPFKNNVLLWVGYLTAFALLGAFTAWNIVTWREHIGKLTELQDTVQSIEGRITDLDIREQEAEAGIKAYDLDALGIQAEKANEVIEWKAFSWTRLFNEMEEVQPYNVRMTSIRPLFRGGDRRSILKAVDGDERQSVAVAVEGTAKDFDAFWDMQNSLLDDDNFGQVDPERLNRGETREIFFQLSFLYFPEVGQEPRPEVDEGEGGETTDTAEAEPAEQVVEQPPMEVAEEPFQAADDLQVAEIPDAVQSAAAEELEPAPEPERPERTRSTRFTKGKRGSKGRTR